MSRVILLCALVAIAILALSACSSATTTESDVYVDPAVLDALEQASEVEVLVFLKPPGISAEQQTIELRSQDFSERWARVMDALVEGDFEVRLEYDQVAAISGTLTRGGLEVFREHSDVERVTLSGQGTAVSEAAPAIGTFTGTISLVVDQIVVDGWEGDRVVRDILEPVTNGIVTILELGVGQPLGADGSFSFRHLEMSEDHMLVSVQVQADGYRPTTWANRLVLSPDVGPDFALRIELGEEPMLTDYCAELLAAPEGSLSEKGHLHAQLCQEPAD